MGGKGFKIPHNKTYGETTTHTYVCTSLVVKLSWFLYLQHVSASRLGASRLTNHTAAVQGIMQEAERAAVNETSSCCDYKHQLLDKFCATRTYVSQCEGGLCRA